MKFRDGLIGFGPNLVFDCESSEQSPFGDDVENRLPSDAHAVVNFSTSGGTVILASVNSRGPPIIDALAVYACLSPLDQAAPRNWWLQLARFRRLASATIAFASGCSELDSTAAARAIKSSSLRARCSRHSRHRRGTACQGSGLIEDHHVQIAGTFECESVLNKEPVLSP